MTLGGLCAPMRQTNKGRSHARQHAVRAFRPVQQSRPPCRRRVNRLPPSTRRLRRAPTCSLPLQRAPTCSRPRRAGAKRSQRSPASRHLAASHPRVPRPQSRRRDYPRQPAPGCSNLLQPAPLNIPAKSEPRLHAILHRRLRADPAPSPPTNSARPDSGSTAAQPPPSRPHPEPWYIHRP
jgi:hypothetical protein